MKLQGIFLNTVPTDQNIASKSADGNKADFNYTFVETIARIAVYDDLRSAPRVIEIQPNTTAEFIENLASKIYEQAKLSGGTIPYTVIREVSENFIHAQFSEIIVSILDQGKTIRFSDQGPGIANKNKAQLPGFTSAIEPMKHYIRGVGSGLPIVKDYLDFSNGTITIEDNLECGAVVTVSLAPPQKEQQHQPRIESLTPPLSAREKEFLPFFLHEGALGVTDLVNLTGMPQSSTYVTLKKLEEYGLIEKTVNQKRILTDLGFQVANSL
ncbi:ATP-binding protein [Raoultibacter timonensis]|uniref:ATP-binding protein n=1 Tax=Raoultibacter timonensis TaxID=1907662 RepID=UPI003CC58094